MAEVEGPIENYEEFFDEIVGDYFRLVSITRLPEFMLKEEELPDTAYEFGKSCGNILIKNVSNKRPETGLGLLLAEHWMIFPELVEPAIKNAIGGGKNSQILGKCYFSLHTFTEVRISFTFANPRMAEKFQVTWDETCAKISESLRKTDYDGELCIRYFNSDMTEILKIQ